MDERRVDDIREDVRELKNEMHQGFNNLEQRFTAAAGVIRSKADARNNEHEEEFKEIRCLIKEIDEKHDQKYDTLATTFTEKFNKLDKKLLNLFLIGNVIGIAVGSTITMIAQTLIRKLLS